MNAQPVFVVVFGAPGTGKTTLLEHLREAGAEADRLVDFLLIDEPTHEPEIAALLKQMYEETADDIAAGRSVAAKVQTLIMEARHATYLCVADKLAWAHKDANAAGRTLVVVSDSHFFTDDKIYVRSKHQNGQISAAQLNDYVTRQAELIDTLPDFFVFPSLFCRLSIDSDHTGAKHHHRVCGMRKNATEANVDTSVFALLALYADEAEKKLARQHPDLDPFAQRVQAIETDGIAPLAITMQFVRMLLTHITTLPQNVARAKVD